MVTKRRQPIFHKTRSTVYPQRFLLKKKKDQGVQFQN